MPEVFCIAREGAGGFLNPPTHPEHTYSVQSKNCSCSLSYAVKEDWVPESIRKRAQELLDSWQRPPLESPEVQDWICQVLGYYKGCYRGEGEEPQCWHASTLKIDNQIPPLTAVDLHAGVRLIRQYYPEFMPTQEHFDNAYWGTKPTKKP